MGYIARLPQSLICHLRSGSILSDLAQCLEELICNSLDAGAQNISAYFDLSSFYIKVEDDGSGITRDDLILIGEQYATSKLHDVFDLENGISSLGFRGEALSSLSNIAIIEVITRVRGSPNTYKKILKGSKTLSIGLHTEQRGPGTTVILREVFHNLPVRRKFAQLSPRKVIQRVKEHALRLALIHPEVSFNITDLERQEMLVHTKPLCSSLDAFCNFFGEGLRHQLLELKFQKENFNMKGFVSTKTSKFMSKAMQFIYINGRFVDKTPIHKLIHKIYYSVSGGLCDLENPVEVLTPSAPSGQGFPAFLLNIICPLSSYDITFEATKTAVEFKNWDFVLSFVRNALETVWRKSFNDTRGSLLDLGERTKRDVDIPINQKQRQSLRDGPVWHTNNNTDMLKQDNHVDSKLNSFDVEGDNIFVLSTPERASRTSIKRRKCPHHHENEFSFTSLVSKNEDKFGNEDVLIDWSVDSVQYKGSDRLDDVRECQNSDMFSTHVPASSPLLLTGINHQNHCKTADSSPFAELEQSSDALNDFMLTPPPKRRAFLMDSQRVRRCLYDVSLKPRYADEFLCHSDRQTINNFDIKADKDANMNNLTIFQEKEQECIFENDTLMLDMETHKVLRSPSRHVRDDVWQIENQKLYEHVAAEEHPRRTVSGPPFYRPKKHAVCTGLLTLGCHRETGTGNDIKKGDGNARKDGSSDARSLLQGVSPAAFELNFSVDSRDLQELDMAYQKDQKDNLQDVLESIPASKWTSDHHHHSHIDTSVDMSAMQVYKGWKNPCMRITEPDILDISSAALGSASQQLLPQSISKEELLNAEVLQQVDKKFIVAVANGILLVIDQHAADERIRLEQLREKVIQKKSNLSHLLDYPLELNISVGEQLLLHTYQSQIEEWGWRFKSNQRSPGTRRHATYGDCSILAIAVPMVLGECLTDTKHLSEYLHQLGSTDGTSAPPPAIIRILASKACRGAIMFGDFLLKSECQQLVEGLKRTSLCFQCAHGRPTLAPIVNFEALTKRLGRLSQRRQVEGDNLDSLVDQDKIQKNIWHGLQWHRPTLQRARERLAHAEEMVA